MRRLITVYVTAILIAFACIWSFVAAPLSANKLIPVIIELASYWMTLVLVIVAGFMLIRSLQYGVSIRVIVFGVTYVLSAIVIVLVFYRLSNSRFSYWKMKSIPKDAWPQMVTDLAKFGKQSTESGINYLPMSERPPLSLRQLGSGEDYKGGVCNIWSTPEYKGVFAIINFGYKDRNWGLCLGPESRAKEYCRGGTYVAVGSNAYFFCGPRD
jgi:hypothetical protein